MSRPFVLHRGFLGAQDFVLMPFFFAFLPDAAGSCCRRGCGLVRVAREAPIAVPLLSGVACVEPGCGCAAGGRPFSVACVGRWRQRKRRHDDSEQHRCGTARSTDASGHLGNLQETDDMIVDDTYEI